jgi:hypothetical protein
LIMAPFFGKMNLAMMRDESNFMVEESLQVYASHCIVIS